MNDVPSVMQSQLSSSASRSSALDESKGQSNTMNATIFALFDDLIQNIQLPNILNIICFLELQIQFLVTSFWVETNNIIRTKNTINNDTMNILSRIAFFFDIDILDDSAVLVPLVFFTAMVAISLFFLVITYIYFKVARHTLAWATYVVRCLCELGGLIIFHPLMKFEGQIIMLIYNNFSILAMIAFILCLVYIIFYVAMLTLIINITYNSAHLMNTIMMTFDSNSFRNFFFLNGVVVLCQFVFPILPLWTDYFLIAIHVLVFILTLIKMVYQPYMSAFSNVLFNAVLFCQIVLDLVMLVTYFNSKWPDFIFPILVCGVFMISVGASYILYKKMTRKAVGNLLYDRKTNFRLQSTSESIILSDNEKLERFASLKLDEYYPNILMHLHYGLDKMCDMFIDFSYIKYLAQTAPTTQILTACLRFVILFPSETRLANIFVNILVKKRDLTTANRFLLFQITRIKLLRQTSSSVHSAERLIEIKSCSKSCRNEIINFFERKDCNASLLLKISTMLDRTKNIWVESLKLFSNSPVFREEYSKYLIESETDFEEAILQWHKKGLIESGVNLSKDECFRSFVNAYPLYLKKNIIDSKGNITRVTSKGQDQSQSSNKVSVASSSTDIDQKIEEEIGKSIMTHAKVRLALQGAIENKKAAGSRKMTFFMAFDAIFSFILFIVLFVVFGTMFNSRFEMSERSMKITTTRMYTSLTTLYILMQWGNETGRLSIPDELFDDWYLNGEDKNKGFNYGEYPFSWNALIFNVNTEKSYNDMADDFAEYANTDEGLAKVFILADQLINDIVPNSFCIGGTPTAHVNYSLRETIVSNMIAQRLLMSDGSFADWLLNNEFFCSIYGTVDYLGKSFDTMRELIVYDQIDVAKEIRTQLLYLRIIIPIAWALLILASFFFLSGSYLKEIINFTKMMLSLDSTYKKEAMTQIRKGETDVETDTRNGSASEKLPHNAVLIAYVVAVALFTLLQSVIIFLQLNKVDEVNTNFQYISAWSYRSSSRSPLMFEILISVYFSIWFSGPNPISTLSTTIDYEKKTANYNIEMMEKARDILMLGSEYAPPITGFDPILDDLMDKAICDSEKTNASVHDSYICVSANMEVLFFIDLYNDILYDLKNYNSIADRGSALEIFHLATQHVGPQLNNIDVQFDSLVSRFIENFETINTIYFVVELVSTVLCFAVVFFFNIKMNGAFRAAKCLLRRISPVAIIGKPELVNYLLDISTEKKDMEISTSASIVHNSEDGIFCLGINGTIEVVNQSVTNILGFTPDQMLGQSLCNICEGDSAENIRKNLELMSNGQSSLQYETHVICINNNDLKVPCSMIMLGITNDNKLSSFVVVIRDETELIEQQANAEKAKQQSESLLYEILPRDIVIRLNQGEKDISFSIPSATISFIDMVKFSEYSSTLSPQQIMGNLSLIFGAFDESLVKYQMVTKIKLIGDVYMSAAGLFDKEDAPLAHAEQMVRFCLDALQMLEDFNIKMSSLLNCRIGINTGGPLIAGVLGTDKPVFDIIGDPINIASRLQSTDIPGKIQISQNTYEIIKSLDFNIESRGEVFLKGKGKQEAYLISPQIAAFQGSLYDIPSAEHHTNANSSDNKSDGKDDTA